MKQFYLLASAFIFFTSCNGQDKTHLPKGNPDSTRDEPKIIPAWQQKIIPVDDPYFVESRDTISTHGPHSITRNMLQDKNGNYWFATWQGVIQYDGKFFTNVTLKEGLKHFHVFSVLEDKTGSLWFGTIRGGVYRYDPSASIRTGSNSYTLFTTTEGLANNTILCMLADKAGNIWIGTDNGVSRYDGKTFTNFTVQDGLSGNSVNSITQDKTGIIWFGTRGGVSCYDARLPDGQGESQPAGQARFTNFTDKVLKTFYNVRSIIEDKTGNIWIGSEDGLYRYDPSASLTTGGNSLTHLTRNFTGYIFEDKTGNIWLSENDANGRGMTLSRYDGSSFTNILEKNDFSGSTGGNQIFGICEDKTGNIWFGTVSGVCRYDPASGKFTDFKQ